MSSSQACPEYHADAMKVILLGESGGGKSCLFNYFVNNRCVDTNMPPPKTLGAAFGKKQVVVKGTTITMNIWDTAGQDNYRALTISYFRGSHAAILCYDLTQREQFDELKSYWVTALLDKAPDCKMYLCGTKKDLIDEKGMALQVDASEANKYAKDIKAEIFQTSSKTGENIDNVFNKIAIDFHESPQSKQDQRDQRDANVVHLDEQKAKSKCFCTCD